MTGRSRSPSSPAGREVSGRRPGEAAGHRRPEGPRGPAAETAFPARGVMNQLIRRVLAAAAALVIAAAGARAHPVHTSVAEADYNTATASLEVSLRVFPDDFEAALSVHARRRLSVRATPATEFDEAARAYLAEKFTVLTREGKPAVLRWVGREAKGEADELWFHFEVPLPGGVEGARIHHHALGEQFPSQINSVRVREADRQVTLVFLPSQGGKPVRFRP